MDDLDKKKRHDRKGGGWMNLFRDMLGLFQEKLNISHDDNNERRGLMDLHPDSKRDWMDLHPDIVRLFLEKLSIRDQIRCLSVCKNWHLTTTFVKSSSSQYYSLLPWLLCFPHPRLSHKLHILDPHTHDLCSIDRSPNNPSMSIPSSYYRCGEVFASKHGWLVGICTKSDTSLFLHNPYKDEVSLLPFPIDTICQLGATFFTPNPESREDCELVVFSLSHGDQLCMNRYHLSSSSSSTDNNWTTLSFETNVQIEYEYAYNYSIHYMNGCIYCIMPRGNTGKCTLGCFHLDYKYSKFEQVLDPQWFPYYEWEQYWLTDIGGNLTLVVRVKRSSDFGFMVLSYDHYRYRWDEVKDMDDGIAFFISDRSILCAPSDDYGGRVFFVDDDDGVVYCYSFKEQKHIKEDLYRAKDVYKSRCFVEPPIINF